VGSTLVSSLAVLGELLPGREGNPTSRGPRPR